MKSHHNSFFYARCIIETLRFFLERTIVLLALLFSLVLEYCGGGGGGGLNF
jgi:hypothetical protein